MSAATVAAGAAVVGAAGSAYSASQAGKGGSTSTQIPGYITDASKTAVNDAETIANRPYTPYTGNRVAGLTPNQVTGAALAGSAVEQNQARGYLDKAGALTDDVAGSQWNDDTAKKYMDPYVDSVVDQNIRKINTASAVRGNALRGQAASVGAFGGDRASLLENTNEKDRLQQVSDTANSGFSAAYTNAQQAWNQDKATKLNAASSYRAVGGDISQLNTNQIADLMKTGGAAQVVQQANNDFDYQQFVENRDWSVTNLQPLLSAISTARGNQTTQYTPPGSSAAGNVLGAAASLAGLYGKVTGGGGYYTGSSGNQPVDSGYNADGIYVGAINAPTPTVS